MRDYGCVAPTFWTRGSGKALRGDKGAQILALYLFTCPSAGMTGVFGLGVPVMAHETGLTHHEVAEALDRLAEEDVAYYDPEAELVYVVRAVVHQVGASLGVASNGKEDRRGSALRKEIGRVGAHPFALDFGHRYENSHRLGPSPFGEAWKPLRRGFAESVRGSPSRGALDQDQDKTRTRQEQEQPVCEVRLGDRPAPVAGNAFGARVRPETEPTNPSDRLSWLAVDFTAALNAATARLWPAVPPFPAESAALEWFYADACHHGASWATLPRAFRAAVDIWFRKAGKFVSHKPSAYQAWAAREDIGDDPHDGAVSIQRAMQ